MAFSTSFKDLMQYREVLKSAKYYRAGDTRCGGILYGVSYSNLTKLTSFNTGALGRCDNNYGPYSGYGFSGEQNTDDLIFKYTASATNNNFATLFSACGNGTSYLKINKILVR